MAEPKGYEVIDRDEVTVPRTVAVLDQADGSKLYQNGMAKTWLLGEVIPPDEVAENFKEALEAKEGALYERIKNKLKPVSDEPGEDAAMRLGLPFPGFDDMEVDNIVAAMSVLPSATIQRIKAYEALSEDPRSEIVDYNIGYGEHPDQRQTTDLDAIAEESEENMDDNKAVRRIATRDVPEDGPVKHGEGVTGTGEPQKAYGAEADAEDDKKAGKSANIRGAAKKTQQRRGRRDRQPKPTGGTPKDQGGGSLDKVNE